VKSIKAHLLATLLISLGSLWLLCSGALYFFTKHSLYEAFDSQLRIVARDAILLTHRIPPLLRPQFRDRSAQFSENGEYFFQAWSVKGKMQKRSKSLGEYSFPYSGSFTKEGDWSFVTLENNKRLRTLSLVQVSPRFRKEKRDQATRLGNSKSNKNHKLHVIIARDTAQIEATLEKLRWGIALGTVLGLFAVVTAVGISVRKGLAPLSQFAEHLSSIGSKNLNERLDSSQTPEELHIVRRKVNALLERIETAFERERRFGSDLAHEIRTPTAEIKALSEVGLKWPDQFGKDELSSILQSTKRMENTTEALLDLARLTGDHHNTNKTEAVNISEITAGVLDSLKHKSSHKNLIIKSLLPPNLRVETNRSLFLIIIQNLLGNAVSYAPEGDQIDLVWDKRQYILSIENTATDLEATDLNKMFERFWRKDEARTSEEHAGLGLRLATLCSERLGFTITPSLKEQRLSMHLELPLPNKNETDT